MAFSSNAPYGASQAIALPQIDTNYLGLDFFMHQPDVLNTIVPGWDTQNFLRMLELTGRAEVCHNEVFTNYESGMNYRAVGIQAVSGTPSASSVTVTLTGDSYTNVGSLKGNIDRSPLKENDIIKLPNRKECFVQVKAGAGQATTYTLVKSDRSADSAFDLGAYIGALAGTAQRLAIPSNGFAEGSAQPLEGIDVPLVRYSGTMQIFKAHMAVTGSAAGDTTHVPMPDGSNKWYSKSLLDLGLKHRTDMAFQHLLGNGGNFQAKDGKAVKTSQGLEGYIRSLGNVYDYPSSGFTMADLDALVARIKALWGGTEYQWIMGPDLRAQVETVVRNLSGGNLVYNMFGGTTNGRDKAFDLGFNSFVHQGVTFHMQESSVFLHPEVTGLAGYNYTSMGILIPGQTKRISTTDNGVTQSIDAPSLRIRYKVDVDNKSRRYSEWKMTKEITGIDETRFEILSHEGLQMVGLRRFILTQRGA